MLTFDLRGTPYEVGFQHGQAALPQRPQLQAVMAARLAELQQLGADRPKRLRPALEALQALDQPLLQQLQGLADGLSLDREALLRYTLSSYLRDLHKIESQQGEAGLAEGCTTWAATAPATSDGNPILVKNRDYHRDHISLQALIWVSPSRGYRYLSIGSAGSPTVFSSGINERGLAVADTHVLSRSLGPGLPRFSLMREILELHAAVASALNYLGGVRHMGGGTLILADAGGHLAICESGHAVSGFVEAGSGYLASTNHFVTSELAGQWIEDEPAVLRGNSPARRRKVLEALDGVSGVVDVSWARTLMSTHGTPQDALCRHPLAMEGGRSHPSLDTSTISSAIFLPRGLPGDTQAAPALVLASGQPCQTPWEVSSPLKHR